MCPCKMPRRRCWQRWSTGRREGRCIKACGMRRAGSQWKSVVRGRSSTGTLSRSAADLLLKSERCANETSGAVCPLHGPPPLRKGGKLPMVHLRRAACDVRPTGMWGTPNHVGNTIGETHRDVGNTKSCREHDWCGKIGSAARAVNDALSPRATGAFAPAAAAVTRVCYIFSFIFALAASHSAFESMR